MNKLQKLVFAGIILFLPSQLGLHFWPEWAFINGVRIDYFSPTLYFTDVLVILLSLLSLRAQRSNLHWNKRDCFVALLLAMTIGVNVYFSLSPFVSLYKWLKIGEMAFLAWYVAKNKPGLKLLIIPIIYSCVLAIWQYFNHGSVGGLWYFLGERTFNNGTPGIAAGRPYGTFPHPNVLMGFLTVSGLIIITYLPHISRKITALVLGLSLITLILLPSRGNLLNGWGLRQQLNSIAVQEWLKSPLIGTGLGTSPLYPRNIANYAMLHQPIHNIFLLLLSETGLVGLVSFLVLLKKRFSWLLLPILFLGFFDHYWLTLQQGQLLFALVLGIIW